MTKCPNCNVHGEYNVSSSRFHRGGYTWRGFTCHKCGHEWKSIMAKDKEITLEELEKELEETEDDLNWCPSCGRNTQHKKVGSSKTTVAHIVFWKCKECGYVKTYGYGAVPKCQFQRNFNIIMGLEKGGIVSKEVWEEIKPRQESIMNPIISRKLAELEPTFCDDFKHNSSSFLESIKKNHNILLKLGENNENKSLEDIIDDYKPRKWKVLPLCPTASRLRCAYKKLSFWMNRRRTSTSGKK